MSSLPRQEPSISTAAYSLRNSTFCFLNRLRELAVTTVNETIEYWLKGLIDGNNGQFPEVSFEFPYLERNDNTEALTVSVLRRQRGWDSHRAEPGSPRARADEVLRD